MPFTTRQETFRNRLRYRTRLDELREDDGVTVRSHGQRPTASLFSEDTERYRITYQSRDSRDLTNVLHIEPSHDSEDSQHLQASFTYGDGSTDTETTPPKEKYWDGYEIDKDIPDNLYKIKYVKKRLGGSHYAKIVRDSTYRKEKIDIPKYVADRLEKDQTVYIKNNTIKGVKKEINQ